MKKNRIKFLIIELFLLMLAVFFVWKIFDQNVAETRIAVILPESGDKRWDALIKGMKQFAAENNVHMIICNTDEIDGPEAEREFIIEQKDNDIDGFILYPAPGRETENMLKKECGNKPYLLMADSLAVKEGEAASPAIQPDYREIGRSLGEQLRTKERKIGIIADWKMSEAVQSEISGLNEALEGSGSEIRWCIYRRKEQNIVERIGAEKKGRYPCGVGCRSSGRAWRTGRKWKIHGRRALWCGLQSEDDRTFGSGKYPGTYCAGWI